MYAVIRTGGKQYKVKVGDVIDVERVSGDGDSVELVPLLVVDDDGHVSSRPSELVGAKVTASVLDQTRGDKLRVFTYKNKTGQRRHQGHRQSLTTIRVEGIEPPGGAKAATRAKTPTRAGADKAKPARAAATKAEAKPAKAEATEAKAEAKPAKAEATEAKAEATEAKAAETKAKAAGSKAKAAGAKEGTAKAKPAKPARTAAKAGSKAEAADTKAKTGGSKDGESKPAGRGGRTRAKQDEES